MNVLHPFKLVLQLNQHKKMSLGQKSFSARKLFEKPIITHGSKSAKCSLTGISPAKMSIRYVWRWTSSYRRWGCWRGRRCRRSSCPWWPPRPRTTPGSSRPTPGSRCGGGSRRCDPIDIQSVPRYCTRCFIGTATCAIWISTFCRNASTPQFENFDLWHIDPEN